MTENKDYLIFKKRGRINELKQKLRNTDYQAIKYAEGALTFAEFAETMKIRQEWRAEINALETELNVLRG